MKAKIKNKMFVSEEKRQIFMALFVVGLVSVGLYYGINYYINSDSNEDNQDIGNSPSSCLLCEENQVEGRYTTISVDEANSLIQNTEEYPELIILDVRTQSEYDDGHIEGALLIPLSELESRLSEIQQYNKTGIIVYCRSGNRSASASQILVDNGFTKILNLDGGFSEWTAAGYPSA